MKRHSTDRYAFYIIGHVVIVTVHSTITQEDYYYFVNFSARSLKNARSFSFLANKQQNFKFFTKNIFFNNKSPNLADHFDTIFVRVNFKKKVIHDRNRAEKLGHPVL